MAVSTEGGSTTATLSAFDDSDFTETQIAKDSKIKVDGFPTTSAASEVQSLTKTSVATAGTFTLTYDGHTTAAIAYNASAAEIQAALEALSNVNSGDITVAGSRLDQAGATTFTFASSLGDVNMISIDPTSLTPSTRSNCVWTETAKGDDGYISRSSNTVDDVISGVSLHLHDTTSANGEEISLTRDIQSVKNKIDSLVASYNDAVSFVKEKTGYNNVLKTAGVLMGDYAVSTFKYQFREPIIEQTAGFVEDIDTFLSPLDIGLELDKDGFLTFDTNKFDEAVAQDYMAVLDVIGADKTGSTNSTTIKFYSASSNYTTAGEYDVQVTVSGGAITNAKIKLSSESTYRTASFSGNIVTGNSTFDTNGDTVYPENGLQLSVGLSTNGTFTAELYVKQGFAGKVEDRLDKMLKATVGSIIIDQDQVDDQIDDLDDKITLEEWRLTKREERLVARFARLERTLALLQSQLAASGIMGLQTT
jgi:flagellar hook-associated protein 2